MKIPNMVFVCFKTCFLDFYSLLQSCFVLDPRNEKEETRRVDPLTLGMAVAQQSIMPLGTGVG